MPSEDLRERVLAELRRLRGVSLKKTEERAHGALMGVAELHHEFRVFGTVCFACSRTAPCETLRIIAKELGLVE